jgi:hypothetical protein
LFPHFPEENIESIPLFFGIALMNQSVRYPAGRPMPGAKLHQWWNFLCASIKSMRQ